MFAKMLTFSLSPRFFASVKSVKNQEMKDLKKSKTKTSKTKTSKAKTTKTKTSKTKNPKYFLCFRLFRDSCSLERNCLMTASKNPENINV